MRPSLVRSKSAPQRSSSSTRSGASWAWSWALRQLFSILPPRMVSRKCTCQLSSGHTLPSAAAMPPSAITVWALPRSDLQMSPTDTPWAAASIAARSPAPPAPMTMTSCAWVAYSTAITESSGDRRSGAKPVGVASQNPQVADHAHGHQPDVEIGQAHAEQREPGIHRMALVEPRQEAPDLVAGLRLGENVHVPAADVAARVAREGVASQEDDVDPHHQRAHADSEAVGEPERQDRVPGEHHDEEDRDVPRVAMEVLEEERKARLARVALDVADGARHRRQPEGAVVGLAVVVAGQPEETWAPQDQEGRREHADDGEREIGQPDAEAQMQARLRDAGRVEGREVGRDEIVRVLERGPRRVDDECAEDDHDREWQRPPGVGPQMGRRDGRPPLTQHATHARSRA